MSHTGHKSHTLLLKALGKVCCVRRLNDIADDMQLLPEQRAILVRHYGEGVPNNALAEEMSMSMRKYHGTREFTAQLVENYINSKPVLTLFEQAKLLWRIPDIFAVDKDGEQE